MKVKLMVNMVVDGEYHEAGAIVELKNRDYAYLKSVNRVEEYVEPEPEAESEPEADDAAAGKGKKKGK